MTTPDQRDAEARGMAAWLLDVDNDDGEDDGPAWGDDLDLDNPPGYEPQEERRDYEPQPWEPDYGGAVDGLGNVYSDADPGL